MTEHAPLAIFDAFIKSFPEKDRRAFESRAIVNFIEQGVIIPGGPGVEAYDDYYNRTFTETYSQKENWLGLVIYLIGIVDFLIWSSLDPENIQYHDHEVDFLNDGKASDEQIYDMVRDERFAQKLIWSERQEQWSEIKRNGLSFAELERCRRVRLGEAGR